MAFISGTVPESFERRVTATTGEFARDLRQAWPQVVADAGGRRFRLQEGDQTLVITIEPVGVRRLGLFELPQLDVRFRFGPGEEAARCALLARLDRGMQKGGG